MIKRTLFYLICFYQLSSFGQKPDSLFYDTLDPKLKLIYKYFKNPSGDYYYTSFKDSKKRFQTRSMFVNGVKRSKGSVNLFHTLKTKCWDQQGRLVERSKQRPFGSTSYTRTSMTKTYDKEGHLMEFRRLKYHGSCFENRGVYRYKIITYNANGKRTSKKKMDRIATWRQWKKTGRAVRIKEHTVIAETPED